MLPRRCRITSRQDFRLARQRGKHWRGEMLAISVLPADPPALRFGFVITRQVGTAVVRNRLKRQLREIVREQLPYLRPGHSVVIVVRPPARDLSFDELGTTLRKLFAMAGLLVAGNGGSTL